MPEQKTIERAREDAREGKSPSTQAGEFVREEFHHIREGKHGARSSRQAIAIGLSKARRAGVQLRAPKRGSAKLKRQAQRENARGGRHKVSRRRSRATLGALKREGRGVASSRAISTAMRQIARRRGSASRSGAARKTSQTRKRVQNTVSRVRRKTTNAMRRTRRATTLTVRRAGRSLLSSATRRMARHWLTGH